MCVCLFSHDICYPLYEQEEWRTSLNDTEFFKAFLCSFLYVLWLKRFNITKWTLNRIVCNGKQNMKFILTWGKWSSQLKPAWTWAIADGEKTGELLAGVSAAFLMLGMFTRIINFVQSKVSIFTQLYNSDFILWYHVLSLVVKLIVFLNSSLENRPRSPNVNYPQSKVCYLSTSNVYNLIMVLGFFGWSLIEKLNYILRQGNSGERSIFIASYFVKCSLQFESRFEATLKAQHKCFVEKIITFFLPFHVN